MDGGVFPSMDQTSISSANTWLTRGQLQLHNHDIEVIEPQLPGESSQSSKIGSDAMIHHDVSKTLRHQTKNAKHSS